MAKARKPPKNEASKSDSSSTEALVLHQKLCLSIDIINRRIYGYTELEIAVPDSGIIGLHAENLEIERVSVDGEPAEFDVFPHYQPVEIENRWCSVSSVSSAADAAGVTYISALERELVPNLLILCRKPVDAGNPLQGQMALENGNQSNGEVKQNVRLIRIDYWVEKAEAGVHFDDDVLHTNSQIRRAHCWFPCMDDSLQRCCYDMEFTVPHNFVAVSNGRLLYQVLSKDDPPRKTFVYKLDVPVSARWISLAIAPFQILPDYHNSILSHMCLPENVLGLQNTVGSFHSAFRHYEAYLKCPFPFGSYKQVFIAPEMVISSVTSGASMSIFSSQILFDEKVIDQTIDTRIKLAHALAKQWFGVYITPETPNDEWLIEGLAGFLTDTYIKEYLGNNEARFRRYKANCAVCKADDSGATTLSPSASPKDLYGTQSVGLYGRIRSWKSVAILQMLEKQMGPELFKGILRTIVSRAQDATRSLRTLSTKEFRHFANKLGNLERPFLKEFFHRWVETCGCPILRMGFSYNKRKNLVELAAFRECTTTPTTIGPTPSSTIDFENREVENGWPGMMTIKVHELDGTHDHLLPMAGDAWQLLEIKCHSRLASKRFQKPKKGSKPDGSDDNGDTVATVDIRSGIDSPLLWVRADPEMEYLAEIHFNQPLQLWINQLEKDRDVVAQAQAIATLEDLPNIPFPVMNALTNFIADSKAFWRVRIQAAFALAKVASEETGWAGMLNLVKFYKAKRFDPSIGLPKPNDFHDFADYFVLEAIPHAVATVRTVDRKSPREAVEFVLQVLKYNDNSGNPYSDVFWLAALVEAIGELEFGQQNIAFLSSLLKRIDRLLQFDRLMPSYNGILTISCLRTITQMALKLSEFIPLDSVLELIKPFQDYTAIWQVRIEARRSLLDIEFYSKGIDAALMLFIKFLEEESSLRGQAKLGIHMIRLSQISAGSGSSDDVRSPTLITLLRLLESRVAFRNVFLRHHLFCILQVLSGRRPTLYVIPRDHMRQTGYAEIFSEQRNNFLAFINQMKPSEPPVENQSSFQDVLMVQEACEDVDIISNSQEQNLPVQDSLGNVDIISNIQVHALPAAEAVDDAQQAVKDVATNFDGHEHIIHTQEAANEVVTNSDGQVHMFPTQEAANEAVTNSDAHVHVVSTQKASNEAVTNSDAQGHIFPIPEASNEAVTISDAQLHTIPTQEAANEAVTTSDGQVHIVRTQEAANEAVTTSDGQVHIIATQEADNEAVTTSDDHIVPAQEAANEAVTNFDDQVHVLPTQEAVNEAITISDGQVHITPVREALKDTDTLSNSQVHVLPALEVLREADTISVSQERKIPVVKFKVKQKATSNKSENVETHEKSEAGHKEMAPVASSSVSVDAPQRNLTEAVSVSNQITEEVNSCQYHGSHMTASIGSAKLAREGDVLGKDLLCTADSSNTPNIAKDNLLNSQGPKHNVDKSPSVAAEDADGVSQSTVNRESRGKEKSKKKDKEKKRKRDDPEYLEKKRLKKEKKKKEKEMAKLLKEERKVVSGDGPSRLERELNHGALPVSSESSGKKGVPIARLESVSNRPLGEIPVVPTLSRSRDEFEHRETTVRLKPNEPTVPKLVLKKSDNKPVVPEASSGHKLRIKFKTRK